MKSRPTSSHFVSLQVGGGLRYQVGDNSRGSPFTFARSLAQSLTEFASRRRRPSSDDEKEEATLLMNVNAQQFALGNNKSNNNGDCCVLGASRINFGPEISQ